MTGNECEGVLRSGLRGGLRGILELTLHLQHL
jgi:hypothetical protein